MSNIFCNIEDVKNSIKKLISLLDPYELKSRNLNEELIKKLELLRKFLSEIVSLVEDRQINDYAQLIFNLSKHRTDDRYKDILYKKSFIIEALSILGVEYRIKELQQYINNSLDRTNTNFSEDKCFVKIKNKFLREYINSLAIYYSLKTVESFENSIARIRFNVGNRNIEEYFAELIAGWILEDYIISKIEQAAYDKILIKKKGVDADRKILFEKIHGDADIHLHLLASNRDVRIEFQRIANSLKPGRGKKSKALVKIKEHKVEKSDLIFFITRYDFLEKKLGKKEFYKDKINSLKQSDKDGAIILAVNSKQLQKEKDTLYSIPSDNQHIIVFPLSDIQIFIDWLEINRVS